MDDVSDSYDMRSPKRGYFLIIMMQDFEDTSKLKKRNCATADKEKLQILFEKLGFEVITLMSPSKDELNTFITNWTMDIDHKYNSLKKQLDRTDSVDETYYECLDTFGVFFGSHTGSANNHLYVKDGNIKTTDLIKTCNIRALASKPKFFIFQSDREGEMRDFDGYADEAASSTPKEADIFHATCNMDGEESFKNESGSWFVQTLVEVFNEFAATKNVNQMFTKIICRMHQDERHENIPESTICQLTCQPRNDFYLKPVNNEQ